MVLCSAVRNDIILSMYIKPTFFNKQPMDADAELAFERPGSWPTAHALIASDKKSNVHKFYFYRAAWNADAV